ncbi:hypothetical protein LTR42_001061 [Elasticomyces elasticus]|nr:hypothetical protein LTR42_001061 [Elasticomyces elasticus]
MSPGTTIALLTLPQADYYQGFAISCLFLLYVQLVIPEQESREIYFARLERQWISGKKKNNNGSLRWFRIVWAMVFQITIARIATVVANEILFSRTCPLALSRDHGFIAITTVQGLSTYIAIAACIIFEHRMHPELARHKGTFKLISFKAVAGLESTQQILFTVLAQKRVFYPTDPFHVSYDDFAKGLPNLILIWELTIVAIFFLWSFSFDEYLDIARSGAPVQASAGRALLESCNTLDILQSLAYSFTGWHRKGSQDCASWDKRDQDPESAAQSKDLMQESSGPVV